MFYGSIKEFVGRDVKDFLLNRNERNELELRIENSEFSMKKIQQEHGIRKRPKNKGNIGRSKQDAVLLLNSEFSILDSLRDGNKNDFKNIKQ